MTTSLEQQREDQALGAAWRRLLVATGWRNVTLAAKDGHYVATFEDKYAAGSVSRPTAEEALNALYEGLVAMKEDDGY